MLNNRKMDNLTALFISYALYVTYCERVHALLKYSCWFWEADGKRWSCGACARMLSRLTPIKAYTCRGISITPRIMFMSYLNRESANISWANALICPSVVQLHWDEAMIHLLECHVTSASFPTTLLPSLGNCPSCCLLASAPTSIHLLKCFSVLPIEKSYNSFS